MVKINCLNPISPLGLDLLTDKYTKVEDYKEAEAVLVRSVMLVKHFSPEETIGVLANNFRYC